MKFKKTLDGNLAVKRKARKYHECGECGGTIHPNEEYYVITYIGDDAEHHTFKICEECWDGMPMEAKNPKHYHDPFENMEEVIR